MTLPSSLRNLRPDTSSPGWPLIPWIPWTLHLLHRLTFPYQAPFPLLALLWNQGRPAIEGRIGRWSCQTVAGTRCLVAVPAVEHLDPHLGEEHLVLMKHLRKREMSLLLAVVPRTLTRLPLLPLALPPRGEGCLLPPTRIGLWYPRAQVTQVTHLEGTVGWLARLVR